MQSMLSWPDSFQRATSPVAAAASRSPPRPHRSSPRAPGRRLGGLFGWRVRGRFGRRLYLRLARPAARQLASELEHELSRRNPQLMRMVRPLPATVRQGDLGSGPRIGPDPRFARPARIDVFVHGVEVVAVGHCLVVVAAAAGFQGRVGEGIRVGGIDFAVVRVIQVDPMDVVAAAERLGKPRTLRGPGSRDTQHRKHDRSNPGQARHGQTSGFG